MVVKEPEEAEDEQEFLAKHIEVLRRVPTSGTAAPAASNVSSSSSSGAPITITTNGPTPTISNGSAATSPILASTSLGRSGDTSNDVSPANSTGHAGRSGESIANSKSEYLAHLTQIAQSRVSVLVIK